MPDTKKIINHLTSFHSIGLLIGEFLFCGIFICFIAFLILGFATVSTLGAEKSRELNFCNVHGVEKIEEIFFQREKLGFKAITQENYPAEYDIGNCIGLNRKIIIMDVTPDLKKITVELEGNFCHETMVVFIGNY
jgi:hypothetical protein